MASSDYILVIDGIKGETADDKFKGDGGIDLMSYGLGVSNTGSHAAGGGGGAGKASFSDFSATMAVNKASPELFLACATGKHIPKAVLHVRKQGGEQQEYMTITMEDLLVSSWNSGDAPGGEVAVVDSLSLNFAKIKIEYKPQKPDGTLDAAVTAGYDVKANKKL